MVDGRSAIHWISSERHRRVLAAVGGEGGAHGWDVIGAAGDELVEQRRAPIELGRGRVAGFAPQVGEQLDLGVARVGVAIGVVVVCDERGQ